MSHPFIRVVQRIVGAVLLVIGIIGMFIPLLPIWMLIIPGIAILGRNDPIIRSLHLTVLHLIKSIKRHKTPWIRRVGLMTYDAYRHMRSIVGQMLFRFTQQKPKANSSAEQ